jgi:cell wall-associated NlpC family hydrolase
MRLRGARLRLRRDSPMLRTRLLFLLLFVVAALCVALARPLPSRADNADGSTTPPGPHNADQLIPPYPVLEAPAHRALRRPASVKHFRIPLGVKVVKYAKRLIGAPYVYGGSSPHGFDCSGFTSYVYRHFHLSIARTSYSQFREGMRVARKSLKPGDLVFFHGVGHVGIYVGHGRFIHAPHTGTRVRIESMRGWYSGRYDGARRLIKRLA